MDVPDEGEQGGCGQQSDAGNGEQVGHDGQLLSDRLEPAFDLLDAGRDVADLATGFGVC